MTRNATKLQDRGYPPRAAFSPGFVPALRKTLGHEGGYVNHPADPGGETRWGITKRTYPWLDIRALTRPEAERVYFRDFWQRGGCDRIASSSTTPIAAEFFDQAVNGGRGAAAKTLQRALNFLRGSGRSRPLAALRVDGGFGTKSLRRLRAERRSRLDITLLAFKGFRFTRFTEIIRRRPASLPFAAGWTRRALER